MSTVVSGTTTGTTDLAISGLASGFDWQSLVSQLVQVERAPEQLLQTQQATIQKQNTALGGIKTELGTLQTDIDVLKDTSFFGSCTATPSNTSLATASAAAGTTLGTYSFNVTQLASAAVWQGASGAAAPLSPTDDVSGLTLSSAPFANNVTAGTFTVNGKQITISTSDTLQSVFQQISNATSGQVTAAYSAANDKITLSSSSQIVLGSATDTSNFLQAAELTNNNEVKNTDGSMSISSAARLGSVNLDVAMTHSNLASTTPISDGGSGQGAFTINGVTINFSATADGIANVIDRINGSGAGVTASYNPTTNQFTLTDNNTGDVGIAVQDVTGNFLQATGLAGGALTRGNNLLYTVNNGPQLSSQSNTITGASFGVSGLSVTALAKNSSFDVTVAADTSSMKTAITNFVTEYNKVQSLISSQTASTTDSTGKVTAGVLTGDQETERLSANLRDLVDSNISGLSLESLGFTSNGQNDSLSTTDLSGLDNALATNLSGLKNLFTNSSTGLAVKLDSFLTNTIGDNGSLVTEQNNLTKQSSDIDTQVSKMETQVLSYQQQLTNEFVAMETADSQINQQLAYITKAFGSSSSSSS